MLGVTLKAYGIILFIPIIVYVIVYFLCFFSRSTAYLITNKKTKNIIETLPNPMKEFCSDKNSSEQNSIKQISNKKTKEKELVRSLPKDEDMVAAPPDIESELESIYDELSTEQIDIIYDIDKDIVEDAFFFSELEELEQIL